MAAAGGSGPGDAPDAAVAVDALPAAGAAAVVAAAAVAVKLDSNVSERGLKHAD